MKSFADLIPANVNSPASIAVDLGAESCRVSLLRWTSGKPVISLVHRFANAPRQAAGGLRWDLTMIEDGLEAGLRRCAEIAQEGIRSIAVDGWAVDYVRVDADGKPWPIHFVIAMRERWRQSRRFITKYARNACVS